MPPARSDLLCIHSKFIPEGNPSFLCNAEQFRVRKTEVRGSEYTDKADIVMPVFEEREDVAEIVDFLPVIEPGATVNIEGDPILAEGGKIVREVGSLFKKDRDVTVLCRSSR